MTKALTSIKTAEIAEFSRVYAEERFGIAVKIKIIPAIERRAIARRWAICVVVAAVCGLYSLGLVLLTGAFGL
jgi:hypothetical protein